LVNTCFVQLLGRTIRVDHVADYKPPKDSDKLDEETRKLHVEGCAPSQSTLSVKQEEGERVKVNILLISGLFNVVVSGSDYVVSIDRMIIE
jgi:hypothetical protein